MSLPKLPPKKAPALPNKPPKKKQFKIEAWTKEGRGQKGIVCGGSGIGKTTLLSLLTKAAFLGVDDGGAVIKHPITGEDLDHVPGLETFQDVRDALHSNIYGEKENIVIDNVTELERWGLSHTLATVPKQGGGKAENIEDYGYHKGYRHWHDTMLLILSDCDSLVRQGKNVWLAAQATTHRWSNPAGEDFLKEGPALYHDKNVSTLNAYCEWADHIFLLGLSHVSVDGNKAGSTNERAVFVHPQIHFIAKSRTISADYPVVEFKDKTDSSIWRLVFDGEGQENQAD